MATVSLRDYLSTSGQATSAPMGGLLATGPGQVSLRQFLGEPLPTATPRTAPQPQPSGAPFPSFLAPLSLARSGLGVASLGSSLGARGLPGASEAGQTLSTFGRLAGGLGALANIPLTLLGPGSDARKALSLGSSAATLGSLAGSTPAITGALGAFGPGLQAITPALSWAGPLLGVGMGALDLAEGNIGRGAGTLAGMGAGALAGSVIPGIGTLVGAGIGAALGGGVGGLFGKREVPHQVREAKELKRHAGQAQGFLGEIQGAASLDDLYKVLLAHQTGYVGGTSSQAVDIGFPDRNYLGLYNLEPNQPGGPIRADKWTPDQFFQAVRERPDELVAGVQAGVRPDMLGGMNNALKRAIVRQVQILDAPGGPAFLRAEAQKRANAAPGVVSLREFLSSRASGGGPQGQTAQVGPRGVPQFGDLGYYGHSATGGGPGGR